MVGDELPYVVGLKFADDDRPTGELRHQQPLDDAKPTGTRSGGQAASVTHVGVVAAKLIGNGARRRGGPRNKALHAKDI